MNRKSIAVYGSGLLQGIALVSFPAASTILTNPSLYGFTNSQYGALFIPQALFSIGTALFNSFFCKRIGANRTLTIGLTANLLSMSLLTLSVITMNDALLTYIMLLFATSFLGIGFGMVVPTINRMTEELWAKKSDQALLTLNALLGVGTALAPLLIALFATLGIWWGLPLSLVILHIILLLHNRTVALPEESALKKQKQFSPLSLIFVFITFAFLYGIIETVNGNWISIYMKQLDSSIGLQSVALTAFWGMVTFGRIFSAAIARFLNQQTAFRIAPFICTFAFLILASHLITPFKAIFAFALMGFGCSVLLPLVISFGGRELKSMAARVPGMIISFYLFGYGVAAFGVGPLEEFGNFSLRTIYLLGACLSLILALLAFYIIHKRKQEGH